MKHLTEARPPYGEPEAIAPGIRRIVAPNPGPMTYHGTNTWLLQANGESVVIDPGPDDPAHIAAIVAAAGRVAGILVTHTHRDHTQGVAALQAATGAPVWGFGPHRVFGEGHEGGDPDFVPDHRLGDGEAVFGLTALHTPGHCGTHLCFARDDGVLFSGDHVMAWSTTVVSPPDGDMAAYMASLDRLLARDDALYLPGHGPALPDPAGYVRALREHRLRRESAILAALAAGPAAVPVLVARVYPGLDPGLVRPAGRSALAHLLMLEKAGRVRREGDAWSLPQA